MRKLTNIYDLPEAVMHAVAADPYDRGECDFTVTQLIAPARPGALLAAHPEAYGTEDVADRLWSLFGQIGHGLLERAGQGVANTLAERRVYAELDGVRIGGKFDTCLLSPAGVLDDFKFTSVWAMLMGLKPEWDWQLNVYAWLLQMNGYAIDRARIVGLLRDWNKHEAKRGGRYPERGVLVQEVPLRPALDTIEFLRGRIAAHVGARTVLPECTPEERWTRPSKWAVVTPKRKTAVRVFDNPEEADMLALERDDYAIEHRLGAPVRCLDDYCLAGKAGLCAQWNVERNKFVKSEPPHIQEDI
jgi:hypothetical protein